MIGLDMIDDKVVDAPAGTAVPHPHEHLRAETVSTAVDQRDLLVDDQIGIIRRTSRRLVSVEVAHAPIDGADPPDIISDQIPLHAHSRWSSHEVSASLGHAFVTVVVVRKTEPAPILAVGAHTTATTHRHAALAPRAVQALVVMVLGRAFTTDAVGHVLVVVRNLTHIGLLLSTLSPQSPARVGAPHKPGRGRVSATLWVSSQGSIALCVVSKSEISTSSKPASASQSRYCSSVQTPPSSVACSMFTANIAARGLRPHTGLGWRSSPRD